MVEEYRFGKIVIDGVAYDHDVIIHPGGVRPNWWRKEGHRLHPEDIREVLEEAKPEVLIVGKGKYGLMKIPEETQKYVESLGIELQALNTDEAVRAYNELASKRRTVGAFHLTC